MFNKQAKIFSVDSRWVDTVFVAYYCDYYYSIVRPIKINFCARKIAPNDALISIFGVNNIVATRISGDKGPLDE